MLFIPPSQEPEKPKAEIKVEKGVTKVRIVYPEPKRGTREYKGRDDDDRDE